MARKTEATAQEDLQVPSSPPVNRLLSSLIDVFHLVSQIESVSIVSLPLTSFRVSWASISLSSLNCVLSLL